MQGDRQYEVWWTFILPFVQKHLGDQAVAEVRKTWQEGMKPIPEGASFEEKYELAYANWIWLAKNIYPFIRKRMGEDGLKKFERAEIEGLIKKNASPAMFMLKIIRAFSPGQPSVWQQNRWDINSSG